MVVALLGYEVYGIGGGAPTAWPSPSAAWPLLDQLQSRNTERALAAKAAAKKRAPAKKAAKRTAEGRASNGPPRLS